MNPDGNIKRGCTGRLNMVKGFTPLNFVVVMLLVAIRPICPFVLGSKAFVLYLHNGMAVDTGGSGL